MTCLLCGSGYIAPFKSANGQKMFKCSQCGLIFVWPAPAQEELKEYYLEAGKTCATPYLLKYKAESIKRGEKILKMVERFRKAGYLLDVGCGCGFFMAKAKERGWKALGVELLASNAELAKKNSGSEVLIGSIEDLSLKGKTFDLISLQHILEHLPQPLKVLRLLRDNLSEGGILAVVVPNSSSLMARFAQMNWLCLAEETHLFHYNPATLKRLLAKSGFKVLMVRTIQWNTRELLWAVKAMIMRKIIPEDKLEAGKNAYMLRNSEKQPGLLKSVIVKMALPLGRLVGQLGWGAEIVALAKKEN